MTLAKYLFFLSLSFVFCTSIFAQPTTWDISKSYNLGDLVVEGSSTYIAKQGVPANSPISNTTYWENLATAASTLSKPVEEVPSLDMDTILNSIPGAAPTSVSSSSISTISSVSGNELLIENKLTGERAVWTLQGKYRQFLTLNNVLTGGVEINEFTPTQKIVASGDFDRDGNLDIVSDDSTSGTKTIIFLSNNTVTSSLNLLTTSTTTKIVGAADFNNDKIIDLVTDDSSSGVKTIHYLSGSGTNLTINSTLDIATDSTYRIAGVLDINSDNSPDFVTEQITSNTDPLFKVNRQIWYTNGTSVTSRITWLTFDQEWTIINVGDFDIDGTPDLMVEQYTTGRKGIWYMNSNGIREGFEYVTLEEKWKSGCSGDFNKDGSTDALFQDNTTGNVIILHLGNQDGSGNPGGAKYTVQLLNLNFVPAGNAIATTDWEMKGFIDHDLNGQSSILAQNTTTGDISLWDFTSGSLSSSTFKNASVNLKIVGSGQFGGDSTPDIILENTSNGQKLCWIMSNSGGSFTISSEETILSDPNNRIVAIGDFNADLKLDLIVEQITSNPSAVFKTKRNIWFMNGTTRVSTHQFLYFDQEWEIKGAKDFDGNGTPDMIVEQKNVGRRGVWYMVGQDLVEGFIYCTVDPAWQFAN